MKEFWSPTTAPREAQKAFDAAVELASHLHASLHMISVEEVLPHYALTMMEVDDEKEIEDTYFGQLAAQAKRRAALRSVTLEYSIVPGHEVKAIVGVARDSGEAERIFRKESERHSGMIPNTIGA